MTWARSIENDGEYTGAGDNPPGSPGDDYETLHIVDLETGDVVAWDCRDAETADQIVLHHNTFDDLLAACERAAQTLSNLAHGFLWGGSARIALNEAQNLWAAISQVKESE